MIHNALIIPVQIQDENYALVIVGNDFDMFNLSNTALQNGIIVPEFFTDRWDVKVGDYLEADSYYTDNLNTLISDVSPQYLGLMLFTSFNYINNTMDDFPEL